MEFIEQLRKLVIYKPEMDILDIGCNNAWLFQRLNKPGRVFDLVDIFDNVNNTIKSEPNVTFHQKSFTEFIPDKKYDLIFARNVLFYSNDQVAEAERYFSYLKDGGVMCVVFMLDDDPHVGKVFNNLTTWHGVSHAELDKFAETKNVLWRDEFQGDRTSMSGRDAYWHFRFFILKK